MPANTKAQLIEKVRKKMRDSVLSKLHDQGVIDLDSPLREQLNKLDKDNMKIGARMLICNNKHYCFIVKEPK